MNDVVLDSSVVVKWLVPESDSAQADQVLVDVQGRGGRLLVLDLAFVEATNAVWQYQRRKQISPQDAEGSLRKLLNSPLSKESSAPLLEKALKIATQYDRAIYDALFVALVSEQGLAGVTADKPLYNAVHADFPSILLLRDWK